MEVSSLTQYVYKKTVKYRKLKELRKKSNPVEINWYGKKKVYESDMVSIRRRMVARDKIEALLEEKELDWL
jgi:hypothetical protein